MSDQTEAVKADQPWEATLILAFRDIQWMFHNEKLQAHILDFVEHQLPKKVKSKLPAGKPTYGSFGKAAREVIDAKIQ